MLEFRLQAVSSSDAKPLILAASPEGLQRRLKAELQHATRYRRPQEDQGWSRRVTRQGSPNRKGLASIATDGLPLLNRLAKLLAYQLLASKPMRIHELKQKLVEEGCSPMNYAIESRVSDAYCLTHDGIRWNVFYSERGIDSDPIFSSESESYACEFFLHHMCQQANWHLVGVFASELEAKAFEKEVSRMGATPIRNDLPESMLGTPQFRVFVAGRDIHSVEAIKR